MKKAFALLLLLSLALSLGAGVSYASDSYVYATTNMTWAEFYAGEVNSTSADLLSAGLDAISTPTTHGLARFPLLLGESGDSGTTITGLKAVQVRMTEDVYNALSNNSRYTVSTSTFSKFKEVSADGTFGAMSTDYTIATDSGGTVTLATGSSARWGHYVFSVSSADIPIASARNYCDNYLGALIETESGDIYGMRHDNNLWSNTDIAFTVSDDYVEPHGFGTKRFYEYTKSLEGQTVTKITYMLKDSPDVVFENLSIYIKKQTSAAISASGDVKTGANVAVTLVSSDWPEDSAYALSSVTFLKEGGNRRTGTTTLASADYSYSAGVLTIADCKAGTYTVTFSDDTYVDIAATFTTTDYYAVTDMTWAEFYAGEVGAASADLYSAGLDAISSPTARVATRFSQLTSESNDLGGRSITGVKDVQVRMTGEIYSALSNDSRYTFSDETFTEYKAVSADGSFGAMVTQFHSQDSAIVTLTAPATWGDYLLDIESIDVTLGSGDTRYYLGALVETSDGKIYGMRHNNNLWFSAKDLAISTAEFVEVHGVSRSYKYTSDMEGKTITKITYMLKNLPDEIISCDVFLKLKTSASVSPVYESGWHAVMAGQNVQIPLLFSNVPSDASYSLSGVTFGVGRGRKAVEGCTFSDGVLTISGDVAEGTYTATFSDKTYSNISATISVFTTDATDKIISADKNAAGLMFLLTPAGVNDSTDAVLDEQNFVNATEYTSVDLNYTENFTGANMIEGSGFTLKVTLNNVPSGKRGIVGFSKTLEITPAKIGENDFSAMSAKILALPDVAYGWRVPTPAQLRDISLLAVGLYPDGVSRDITDYISSGVRVDDGVITFSYGTVLIDREFSASEEGKVYALSDEGEATMSDGAFDSVLTATWYVTTPGGSSGGDGTDSGDKSGTESGDKGSSGGSSTTYVTPGKLAFTLTESKKAEIKEALAKLSSKITSATEVAELPDSAIKGTQSIANPDANTVYLPIIEVSEDKIYVFGVSLDKFAVNAPIFWHSNAVVKATGAALSAADDEEAAIFMNDNGDEVSTNPSNKHVNVAVYLEAGKTYYPTITTTSSGGGTDSGSELGVGSAGGGCNFGITLPVLLLGLGFVIARKK